MSVKKHLPNNLSICSASAHRILLELDMVHQSTGGQLLFSSDSLLCLQSLQNRDLSHPLIAKILCRVHDYMHIIRWYQCCFIWVHSHVGLAGTLATDIAANAALLLPV